jgi:bifunctional pyridoxal-dependent enzyme with beta-cystathionase and maltose regulon repressor activities
MRISFACSMETLEKALRRIEAALSAAVAKRA